MNTKTIVSVALGLFVVASIAYMAIPKPKTSSSESPTNAQTEVAAKGKTVVVYYLYDSIRCQTCMQIEKLTEQVLKEDFAKELADGKVIWKPINTDDSGNEHYLKDYSIMSKSVVVSLMSDGKQIRWSNLKKVWELIKDESSYKQYIRDEVAEYMENQ